MKGAAIALVLALVVSCEASIFKRQMTGHASQRRASRVQEAKDRVGDSPLNPVTEWFDVAIDHFDNHGADSPTY
jgi:hypothetical protein